jgi:hypothetical protein
MRVGDKVIEEINEATLYGYNGKKTKKQGTVEYIHPKQRFYQVRFDFERGSFRESFIMGGMPMTGVRHE